MTVRSAFALPVASATFIVSVLLPFPLMFTALRPLPIVPDSMSDAVEPPMVSVPARAKAWAGLLAPPLLRSVPPLSVAFQSVL